MAALGSGHLATDFANGALPALLPFLADEFDLSYVLVGLAMLAWAFSSSILQPLFGLWSDRRGAIWLLPGGPRRSAASGSASRPSRRATGSASR